MRLKRLVDTIPDMQLRRAYAQAVNDGDEPTAAKLRTYLMDPFKEERRRWEQAHPGRDFDEYIDGKVIETLYEQD